MKCNVGEFDKALRLLSTIIIAGVGIYFNNWWGIVAVFPFVTGLFSYCPIYTLLGVNTNRQKV